ncbi:MAG: tRNA (adenosine(37)-N6)-threonylcarbamoyltransferase complex ATPase subunit type 1 TsaE [Rhodothermaceae bacterium]|nr:tRNA (adenosine(37)-N6)-threonylcarbamoyltransferase complex ATPase subunit type 1 TsaE [Rhodothermaceae bacterium]MXZ58285.1 tRNA (adenosine(37)-N6)-threonylcarbamoyltransferase complex ATPase subunit type 1 TsaE [Rhodothermaceae bacterium]MYB92046.1 tRNA (adenosine(37)-N6)-threonylcarbamoyltransferase complex ATPase subunit type 1 TsaE [Rhodothermaceae bacterium]MYD67971.1 tRNA (adenosine(37)-N6)-threonylcarbamoyltransferase complex ATPase subunit type 1 TsaE [Rhodothermaceae bacterium]MYG
MHSTKNSYDDLVDLITSSPSETQSLGRSIGAWLPKPSVLGLDGPLGAGKTCFVQGLARGLGIPATTHVTSPAYTLVQEYLFGSRKLVHIDFYRLSTLTNTDFMLFQELLENPNHIVVIEWASKFLSDLVPEFLTISISLGQDKNQRNFQVSSTSPRYVELLDKLSNHASTDS